MKDKQLTHRIWAWSERNKANLVTMRNMNRYLHKGWMLRNTKVTDIMTVVLRNGPEGQSFLTFTFSLKPEHLPWWKVGSGVPPIGTDAPDAHARHDGAGGQSGSLSGGISGRKGE